MICEAPADLAYGDVGVVGVGPDGQHALVQAHLEGDLGVGKGGNTGTSLETPEHIDLKHKKNPLNRLKVLLKVKKDALRDNN